MCRHLWDHDHDDDHFITQLNPDGSVHDKVRRSHRWLVTGRQASSIRHSRRRMPRLIHGQS